ncbi:di-heme oxidoreductase family protein [Saccharospirillum salsuginis]|uniref:Thiol oxidoreductase n=1 Tax=Saccharospirillum salsuginis TaxID=418750 RepID=A0A918NDA5_9GAMM|nr:di-heme oxidoredictase family protein [Saccharospirillum salsuginis]GGX59076.1 thiol oxidoreductase [Saccharospirillum salsuginis]
MTRSFINRPLRKLGGFVVSMVCAMSAWADLPFSGGDTTVHAKGSNAFSLPSANLSFEERLDFSVGNSFFRNPWIPAPATTTARDGLGPLFNTNACQNCHIKDGRGHLPENDADIAVSMLVRISVPSTDETPAELLKQMGNVPEPTYGGQFQDASLPGTQPEGRIRIRFNERSLTLANGREVRLREPVLDLTDLNYGPLADDVQTSIRVAPAMNGLGLLEAIPDTDILAWEDPDDDDGDGISGRANWVWDQAAERTRLGRFGWKAGQPTLRQQNAAAFNGDMGLTTDLFVAENCTSAQTLCADQPNGGSPEVRTELLDNVTFYSAHLGVPAQRDHDAPEVLRGAELFEQSGCAGCHRPTVQTGLSPNRPALSGQTIHPFTDLLLHDMGPGLADHRPEFRASGREWRTPPLWGIGLLPDVNGHQQLLHDGRARNVLEAILWHGGEAEAARTTVEQMTEADLDALLAFVNSL